MITAANICNSCGFILFVRIKQEILLGDWSADQSQQLDSVSPLPVTCGPQELTAATCRTSPSGASNGNTGVSGFYPLAFSTWTTSQMRVLWTVGTLLEASRGC